MRAAKPLLAGAPHTYPHPERGAGEPRLGAAEGESGH